MLWLGRVVFSVLLMAALACACWYLHKRLVRDVGLSARTQKAVGWALVVLTALSLGAMVMRGRDGAAQPWGLVPRVWLAIVLNLLWLVLVAEVGLRVVHRVRRKRVFGMSLERRLFLHRATVGAGAVTGLALTGVGAYRAYEPARVTDVPVVLPGLPKALDGLVIAHLSDVHIGAMLRDRFLDDLVARTNAIKPDLVAITGDLVDGRPALLGSIVARLGNLHSRYGTYFVTGNHDYYSGANAWVRALRGMNVNVLRNERVIIGDAAASFDLLGVDDWGRGGSGDYDFARTIAGRDPTRASVLLAHQPSNFDEVARQHVGLQLSGHTHGGQMFPATLIADVIWGERSAGLSRYLDAQLFVSRGCGFVGPAQRLGSPPEIGRVVLLS